jgi:hypothetical protein
MDCVCPDASMLYESFCMEAKGPRKMTRRAKGGKKMF